MAPTPTIQTPNGIHVTPLNSPLSSPTTSAPATPPKPARRLSLKRLLIFALLLFHTSYTLFTLLLNRPTNIFTSLDIRPNAPVPLIREKLRAKVYPAPLPAATEQLLTKFQSFDIRVLYVRFGHRPIESCDWCHVYSDFALFALPVPAIQYIIRALLIGLMTVEATGKRRWRFLTVASIAAAAALELWTTLTSEIDIYRTAQYNTMLSDRLWLYRHIFFLLLPIFLSFLPPTHPIQPNAFAKGTPLAPLPQTLETLQTTLSALQSYDLTHAAAMRHPQLRERVIEHWSKAGLEAQWIREDEGIRKEAERLGIELGAPPSPPATSPTPPPVREEEVEDGMSSAIRRWRDGMMKRFTSPSPAP